jgi:TolB-like protein/DNA-binding winged helix-turn-helix (wHTH) protein/Tfp pilus assembly protein PilF
MTADERINLFSSFTLDLARGCVLDDGQPVHLRPQAYEVLRYLVENRGHLISKDQLIAEIWRGRAVTDGSLGKCIEEVREALGPEARRYVQNVRGRGYIFDTGIKGLDRSGLQAREAEEIDILRITVEENEEFPLPASTVVSGQSSGRLRVAVAAVAGLLVLVIAFLIGTYFFRNRVSTATPITSIAVLPFRNETGDAEVEYLSDGISESLINKLSQLPQLKVIARNSVFHYKGNDVNPQEVSRTLGVQAILIGRVAQRGENLVVSIELMDARDKSQIWGERYTRKSADIQTIQEEMTRTISEKLRLRLSSAQGQQLEKHATSNSQAYQFYLNGLFNLRKGQPDNVKLALDYYNRAIALDPDFALAWVGVAQANRYFSGNSLRNPKEALATAKVAVQKALELDNSLAEAHVVLAGLKTDEWDWSGAEREYQRALDLNPNLVDAHHWYSTYLSNMGRHAEALNKIKRAQELDPLEVTLIGREAWALTIAGRCDEALQTYQLLESSILKTRGLGFSYEKKGMHREAIEEFRKTIELGGETTSNLIYLGFNLAQSGRKAEAQSILDRLRTTKEYVSPEELAGLHIAMGDREGAFALLEKAYAEHDLQLQFLKVDWRLDSLRSDPRFQDLMRRVGLNS